MSISTIAVERRTSIAARLLDYLELTKPKIALLELVTVAVAALLAGGGTAAEPWAIVHVLIGTALVAASASALNQWLERQRDACMSRTANRPLPAGRLSSYEALGFALASVTLGASYLAVWVNGTTALLGLIAWGLYVGVYTPLKYRTSANTFVGAVAGALPVLMGWTAVDGDWTGRSGVIAATLFLIVFLWQFPHFMAIAWIYRREYQQAGARMLTVVDPLGRRAGSQAVLGALVLVPVSLLPAVTGWTLYWTAPLYFVVALTLGVAQFASALRFMVERNDKSARQLLHASLVYLPALLGMLLAAALIFPRS